MPRVVPTVEQLVAAAKAGESRAVERLFARFQPLVRRLLRGYRHLPVAEDLPGEVYLAFAKLVGQFDVERGIPFTHYIARMLPAAIRTVVRRECRVQAREIPLQGHAAEFVDCYGETSCLGSGLLEGAGPPDFAEDMEFRETLQRLLAQLPPRQADVFIRRALRQEDYPQIASALGNSPGTVRVLYANARQRLQQSWREICCEES